VRELQFINIEKQTRSKYISTEILPIWNERYFRQNSALNGYYAASSGLFGFLTLEDGTDRLSLNVAKGLPLLVA